MKPLTAQRLVERSLAYFSSRVAVIDGTASLTYAALRDRTGRLSNVLVGLGASSTRPAAALLPNETRVIETDLACMRAGVTRVAISPRLSADECQFIIGHSQAAVLVTNRDLYERIGKIPDDVRVLLVDGTASGCLDYDGTLAKASSSVAFAEVGADAPAYILYTSGTTGRPKGATHSHGARVAALNNMLASEMDVDAGSAMVHCGPLSHGSGSKALTFLALGARNIVLGKFDPGGLARVVRDHGGSHTFLVPTMLQMLLDAGPEVRDAVRRMRQISFGGAPITNALFGRSLEAFGPILTQVYGTSEAPHPVTVLRPEDYIGSASPDVFAETAGRVSLATDARIVDDDGKDLAVDGEGELWVSGPHLMRGYWRDEAATREVMTPDGWYATGDVATIDEAGFLRLRDRKRDLIITGGLNVYPSEVERVLAEHPAVREVAVVGYPDERWGESILACIVPAGGEVPPESDMIRWLDGRIAGYKKPRRIEFMPSLPKGSTNKILKRELKMRYWAGHQRLIS